MDENRKNWSPQDWLDALEVASLDVRSAIRARNTLLLELAQTPQYEKLSWQDIADVLELSRQGARQLYLRLLERAHEGIEPDPEL